MEGTGEDVVGANRGCTKGFMYLVIRYSDFG